METKASEEFPAIEWEIGKLLDRDIDERMEVFEAMGHDNDGNQYEGTAYYFSDMFDEITNIQLLLPQN